MSVKYRVTLKGGETHSYDINVCYSPWYNRLTLLSKLVVWLPRKGVEWVDPDQQYCNFGRLTDSELLDYFIALREIGFAFRSSIPQDEKINVCCEINMSKHSYVSAAVLLNALRYTYEDNMSYIPKKFLEYAPQASSEKSLWNLFVLAHYAGTPKNRMHTILPMYNIIVPMDEKGLRETVLENKVKKGGVSSIWRSWATTSYERDWFRDKVTAGTLDEAWEAWRKITANTPPA